MMLGKVVKKELLTKDRLIERGMSISPVCVMCELQNESMEHLYFDCRKIFPIYVEIMHIIGITGYSQSSQSEWRNMENQTC